MKQGELKKCSLCKKGIMNGGCPVFYRVEVERLCVDMSAVQRRHGLELMVGSPALAAVLGPNEDIAKTIDKKQYVVCQDCALKPDALLNLLESD